MAIAQPDSEQRSAERERDESSVERLDRNLDEMIGELRVVVTGIQVLFAFLLIVPFNSGFAHVGGFLRVVYFVSLVFAALAAACAIAPSAYHRVLFREEDKRHLVAVSNRIFLIGLAFLAIAICGCLLLVATKLFGVGAGLATLGGAAVLFAALWFGAPLARRGRLARKRTGHTRAAR
jgi:hypothetical protein